MIKTTVVRIAVAKLEFTPSMPTLARIEVNAAKIEERIANSTYIAFWSPLDYDLMVYYHSAKSPCRHSGEGDNAPEVMEL